MKRRVRKLEIEVSEGQQYHRRNNIVISGIPANVLIENLESQVMEGGSVSVIKRYFTLPSISQE